MRYLILIGLIATAGFAADGPDPKLPQYKRMLMGEDAKRAAELDQQHRKMESQDDYKGAIEAAKELQALRGKALGADHYETVEAKFDISRLEKLAAQPALKRQEWRAVFQAMIEARSSMTKGQFAIAYPAMKRYADLCRELFSEDHPATATSYNDVAYNLNAQGKTAEAEPFYRKALDIRRRVLGEDHHATATSYNNVAHNLSDIGKAAEAQPLYWKALDIYRRVLGEDHHLTATSYNNVAANLDVLGKVAEAQPLFQKALDIRRRVLGEDHLATATSYNNVATNLNAMGKAAEAQPLLQKALDIYRRVLGEDHHLTATGYNNVAANLDVLGKVAEAQPLLQKALDIRRRVRGEDHPDTAGSYSSVAANLDNLGKAAEAQTLVQKALDIRRRVLGEDHPSTAISYNNLATNLSYQGKDAEAESPYSMALDIRRRVLGEDHLATAASYYNVAINLNAQGKVAEAESYLRPAVFAYEASRLTGAIGLDRASLRRVNPRLLLAAITQAREPLRAWGDIELSLARGLLDQQANAKRNLTPMEVAEWKREQGRKAAFQTQILALVSKAKRSDDESAQLEKLLSERRQVEERLADLAVRASTREVASSDAIQAALPTDAALLLWVDVEGAGVQEHWACLVRRTGIPKWERLLGTGPEKKWTKDDTALPRKLRDALAAAPSQGEVESLAKHLHAQRIAPVAKHLDGVKTLYVVPVETMAGVPVEALTQDYTIGYVPSGTYLARIKDHPTPTGTKLLAVGDPIFADPNRETYKPDNRLPPSGLLLTTVIPDGAAAKAGLRVGDALLKYGDVELTSLDKLKEALTANANAQIVVVTVWRETAEKPFTRDIAPGKLGVVLATEPAPIAVANRRQTEAMLFALRGGEWKELPGTRVETNRLKQLVGLEATILTDSAASEQQLEDLRKSDELGKFRYLHFATHGEGNRVLHLESSLILAQDKLPKEFVSKVGEPYLNGQLSASEVLEFWKLNAELVTLSACETAIGKKGGGDGLLGFAQAFLTAGARSVCLSLWKVDDTATALLMSRFYENLLGKREGLAKPMGKAAALDEAKRWLRNLSSEEALTLTANISNGVVRGTRGKDEPLNLKVPATTPESDTKPFAHPRDWAAFILIGDPN